MQLYLFFSLVFRNGNTWGPEHATLSASTITNIFDADEYITGFEATQAPEGWLDALHVFTNKKNYGPYGAYSTNGLVRSHCDNTKKFAYITGKQGMWYNSINFHLV